MPIQWSGRITSQQQLAGVIQGEAGSDPAAQFAVAATMYNRMSTAGPYVGGGSGDVTAVVLPSQFNGYNPNPNSNAMSLAGALMNGQAPPGGSTGNATFFAAPVQGNAAWAAPGGALFDPSTGGTNIGGNYFTDRLGAPSANFQAPNYTGAGTTIANGPVDSGAGANGGVGPDSDPLGTSVTMNPSGTSSTTSPTTTSASGAAQGTPIQTALQPEEVSQISSWITGIESAFGGGLKSAITAAETAAGTWLGSVQNWFTRAGLIFLGIVIVAIALIVIMWDHGGKTVVVQAAKAAAA
jgi:hypothetical protein